MDIDVIKDTAFQTVEDDYNKNIKAVPIPEKEIGIDLSNSILQNIADSLNSINSSKFDISAIDSFTNVSRSRNEIYNTLDYMAEDSTLAAVLETYAEDATETNDQGKIVWAESADGDILKFITYLLEALNVDKNVYKWTHSLCKYGDVYLRLYRESDYQDLLFNDKDDTKSKTNKLKKKKKSNLNEDVIINAYSKNDNYIHYIEMAPNPAQIFELTRFGKTAAYIQTEVQATQTKNDTMGTANPLLNKYNFNKNDVHLFPPFEWVHGCLEDNSSRIPEEVTLFLDDQNEKSLTYNVKRGQALLYNVYKVWRQLMLLENSVLLNRVTQSSIVRVIGVEVGDMPKESVRLHLMQIKELIEQKSALDVGHSLNEYTNPGPVVNNVYVPIRNQKGTLTTQQIGGEVKIGDLADLDHYQDKMFGSLRVPKQYFGITDDNAGFSGGESLSIISSRYAKMIKRIQNVIIQMITDAINLILIDTGNDAYINKFTLKMQAPTTKEEVDRRDNLSSKVQLVRDIMDTLADIENTTTKLKILKSLLSSTISDSEVIQLLQDEIDTMEADLEQQEIEELQSDLEGSGGEEENIDDFNSGSSSSFSDTDSLNFDTDFSLDSIDDSENTSNDIDSETNDNSLPSPADLGAGDFSDLTNPELT